MKKKVGYNYKVLKIAFLIIMAIFLSLVSCSGNDDSDPHEAFLRASSVLFKGCSDVKFDVLERYEYAEYGEVFYYLEANYVDHIFNLEDGATSGIIRVYYGGSWDFYHSEGFSGIGENVYLKYLEMKTLENGRAIVSEELDALTHRVNEALKQESAETAE